MEQGIVEVLLNSTRPGTIDVLDDEGNVLTSMHSAQESACPTVSNNSDEEPSMFPDIDVSKMSSLEQAAARMYFQFYQFYKQGLFCDAIIKTEDNVKFPIHMIVVAGDSPFFEALFLSPLRRETSSEFLLRGITSDMLRTILEFIYTRSIDLTENNVTHILEMGDYLGIECLKDLCSKFIEEEIDAQNCIGIRSFAETMFCHELEKTASSFIMKNFTEVLAVSEELIDLPVSSLKTILKDDRLNAREDIVWNAILKWINADPETRKQYIFELIQNLRSGLLETQFFMEQVKEHPYIKDHEGCKVFVIDTLRFLYNLELLRDPSRSNGSIVPLIARPRLPHELLFAIGGWSGGSPTNIIECYDTKADKWSMIEYVDTSGPRAYHGTVSVGHDIYVIGGFDGNVYFNTCRRFNVVTKKWSYISPMVSKRCYVSVAVIDDKYIYAMGGYDGHNRQNTVEKYNISTNQWSQVAPMNYQRSDASAASLNGKIYMVGGFNGSECLDSCEVYDPITNRWEETARMRHRRSGVSAIAYHNLVYVLGGFNGTTRLNSVEVFDPTNNFWFTQVDMYNQRSNFAVEVIEDMIYCIGGFNGSSTIYHVECFHDSQNEWYEATDMHIYRSALSAVVISDIPNVVDYIEDRSQLTDGRNNSRNRVLSPLSIGGRGTSNRLL